jgi:hypothetical protein
VGNQAGLGHAEQRADEGEPGIGRGRRARRHARKTGTARATQQAQEKVFHLIVRVMGQGEGAKFTTTGHAGKERVTQFARRHFNGDFVAGGGGFNIGAAHVDRAAHFFGGAADELFIGLAGPPPELVVEMNDRKLPAVLRGQGVEQMQEDQGIDAARNCDQDSLAGRNETRLPKGSSGALEEVVAHAGILPSF